MKSNHIQRIKITQNYKFVKIYQYNTNVKWYGENFLTSQIESNKDSTNNFLNL